MSQETLSDVDVVFLGPSLSHDEARTVMPDAVILGPASMGDVLAASTRYRPHSITLIDGTFLSNMSVFHKEILWAMDQGTWVIGASSMGALRAAECDDFGMIGIGSIYEALASGELQDDDEVALTHADAAQGYRTLSDAMVTIRATLLAARNAGVISADEAEKLIALQKSRYFPDRRLSSVPADALSIGVPEGRISTLKAWVRENVVDPKRADAIAALHAAAVLPRHAIPERDRPNLVMSGVFSATLSRDTFVAPDESPALTHDRLRRYASLHRSDYPDLVRRARTRQLLAQFSIMIGGQPSSEEFEIGRHRIAALVGVPVESLDEYFVANDVSAYAAGGIIGSEAVIARLEKSWLIRGRMGALTNGVIAEMVLDGTYAQVKKEAALQYEAAGSVSFEPAPDPATIVNTFVALTGFDPGMTWEDFADLDDHNQVLEMISIMEVSVKAHHALFGTGLMSGGDQHFILDHGPMQTRGR